MLHMYHIPHVSQTCMQIRNVPPPYNETVGLDLHPLINGRGKKQDVIDKLQKCIPITGIKSDPTGNFSNSC